MKEATGGRGADVIYDGLGREAAAENLAALAMRGHWVSYGQASGAHDPLRPRTCRAKSVTLSRPVLFHYTAERPMLKEIARKPSRRSGTARLRVDIRHRYPLAAAAEAHRDLEARRTTGSVILLP